MDKQGPGTDFWSSRRWLARFSFSFLILAIYLVYTGYRGAQTHQLGRGRILLCFFAGLLAFVLFMMGARERHRPRTDDEEKNG